jgi:hypothetical protein
VTLYLTLLLAQGPQSIVVVEYSWAWSHLWHFVERLWVQVLQWNSATSYSTIRDILFPLLLLFALIGFRLREWRKPSVRDVVIPAVKAAVVSLTLIGLAVIAAIPVVVWQDHADLVKAEKKLIADNKRLSDEINRLNKPTAPVSPRPSPAEARLDLRKRLIRLSHELIEFREDREKTAPSPTYFKIDDIDQQKEPQRYDQERIRQQAESLTKYNVYDKDTARLYTVRFQARVLKILHESTDAGLDIQFADRSAADVVNGLGVSGIGQQLARLADKL